MNGLSIFKDYFHNPDDCVVTAGGWCELHTWHIPPLEKPISPEDIQIVEDIGWKLDWDSRWYRQEWN